METARQVDGFYEVYVNTDSDTIAALAESCGVRVYRRPERFGSDATAGDDFTADFLDNVTCNTLVMINPVCPLVTASDIRTAMETYLTSDCDTLISCETTQMQVFCRGSAVNIDAEAPLTPSQGNPAVQILNWAVTIWDVSVFIENYSKNRNGYLGTRRMLFPIERHHGLKISHEADFIAAEMFLRAQRVASDISTDKPMYWSLSCQDR